MVAYSTDLKQTLAGVDETDLRKLGPIHGSISEQLASGARERLLADYGLGVTGVAGPGEQGGRPVGEVFVAVAFASDTAVRHYHFEGSRGNIRMASVKAALSDLVDLLDRHSRLD